MNKGEVRILPDADTKAIKNQFLDISYGTQSEFQKLDIYLPDIMEGNFPTILFFHGGAWYAGDKADTQVESLLDFVKDGYAVISINYRLSGEACFPAGYEDCLDAYIFICNNAAKYHIDTKRIALSGESAGAYYVLMLLGAEVDVRCANVWYPVTDIGKLSEQMKENGRPTYTIDDASSPESRFMGRAITELSVQELQNASPIYYIHTKMPYVLIQHGLKDGMVAHQQSVSYYERMKEMTGEEKVLLELFEDTGHGDSLFKQPKNMARVKAFFDEHLKHTNEEDLICRQ